MAQKIRVFFSQRRLCVIPRVLALRLSFAGIERIRAHARMPHTHTHTHTHTHAHAWLQDASSGRVKSLASFKLHIRTEVHVHFSPAGPSLGVPARYRRYRMSSRAQYVDECALRLIRGCRRCRVCSPSWRFKLKSSQAKTSQRETLLPIPDVICLQSIVNSSVK